MEARRGWLVDGVNALLHLTRTQLSSSPYSESKLLKIEDFNYGDPLGGASAAKNTLLDQTNRDLLLFETTEVCTESKASVGAVAGEQIRKITKRWTYEDLVQQTYHLLEQIEDYQVKMMSSATIGLRFTDREKLIGFGFMDIVDGQNILLPRVATLKRSGRGWVDFIRSIQAVTLLGKGFGELIRPTKSSNKLCKHWNQVPMGKDYLVACTSTLAEICRKHGDLDSDPLQLASGIYWHKSDKLFESCECKREDWKVGCDRVQVLLPPSLGSKRHPRPFDCRTGAVIFGRSRRFPWQWPSKGDPVEGEQSDVEPDDESDFRDSGVGESNPSTSETDSSGQQDSSPLDGSSTVSATAAADNTMMSGGILDDEAVETATWMLETTGEAQIADDQGFIPSSEIHQRIQMVSRGVKRTLDKVKETALQISPRKKQNVGLPAHETRLDDS